MDFRVEIGPKLIWLFLRTCLLLAARTPGGFFAVPTFRLPSSLFAALPSLKPPTDWKAGGGFPLVCEARGTVHIVVFVGRDHF